LDAPSQVSIEVKHTASSKKNIPPKTKKDRIFFKSFKNRSKQNEFVTSSNNDIPPSKPTENRSSETSPIKTMLSTEELENIFTNSKENMSICSDSGVQGTDNTLGSIGKSSSFPARNRSFDSLLSFEDQSCLESSRQSSFFSRINSDASYDNHTLSTRENSLVSGATHLSDITSDRSLRRSKNRSSVSGRRRSRLKQNRTCSFQTIEESSNDVVKDPTENRVVALPSTTSRKIQYILTRKVNDDNEEQSDDEETNKETRSVSTHSMLQYDDTSVVSNVSILDFVRRMVTCVDTIGVIDEGDRGGYYDAHASHDSRTFDDGETQTTNQSYRTGRSSLKSYSNPLIYRIENSDSATLDERTRSLLSDGSSNEERKMKQIAEDHDEEIASLLDDEDYDDDTSNGSNSTRTWQLAGSDGLCAM